jgi:hypothetical protein
MTDDRSKATMIDTLRTMLRDVFRLRRDGAAYARLTRAHGYVDGYMRAMMESGIATQKELLEIVAAERKRVDGPATTADAGADANTGVVAA